MTKTLERLVTYGVPLLIATGMGFVDMYLMIGWFSGVATCNLIDMVFLSLKRSMPKKELILHAYRVGVHPTHWEIVIPWWGYHSLAKRTLHAYQRGAQDD